MVIVYESKTGFTKKYAEILSSKTGFRAFSTSELKKVEASEEVIFLGWIKVGKIQGLNKVRSRGYKIKAVCGSGTARTAEPDTQTVIERNKIEGIPFFYLRGGCLPLNQLKGMDKFMLKMFVKMLKNRKNPDEKTIESISVIENGFDGVREENLEPLLQWLKQQ